MAQPPLHLVIGNYNTSSWSLRAWLALRLAGLAFVETRLPLRRPETPGRIAAVSPSGKLPVLLADGVSIWDSLAIAEFVAELEPGIWPLDPIARAEARSISAEVHSGFTELRRLMPMDVVSRFGPPGRLPRGLAGDVARIMAIWEQCRARNAGKGPFLFGAFSVADCMMAPIVTRFMTHGVPLEGVVEDYVDSVMSWPDMVTWCNAAAAEQAEREASDTLGMVTTTRPGRVLGQEAAEPAAAIAASTTAAPAAGPVATVGTVAARDANAAGAGDHEPALRETAAATESRDLEAASFAAGGDHERGGGALSTQPAAPPDAADGSTNEPERTATRRRLFEASAGGEVASGGLPSAADTVEAPPAEATRAESAAADRSPPIADDDEAPQRTPKLGWIRRPVPVEHIEQHGLPRADEAAKAAPRQPVEPPRPSSPAVKPIGGGILRRR
jgi:glutathione S-transferase